MDDDDCWPDFPVILGQGSVNDLSGDDENRASRLWDLKSTSKAACIASDAKRSPKARRVGFVHGRVKAKSR